MKVILERGATSVILHVEIMDTSSTTGGRKTAMTYATSGLACSKIRPGEAVVTGVTFEDITTLGTYQAPTSNAHIRFKKIDDTNWPGLYEIHLHNDWLDVTNSRRGVSFVLFGAANMMQTPVEIELTGANLNTNQLPADSLDLITIDGKTFRAALRYIAATTGGVSSGAGTGTEEFKGLDGSTVRVSATMTGKNRTAVAYDPA